MMGRVPQFSNLFRHHRSFDVAERCRCVYATGNISKCRALLDVQLCEEYLKKVHACIDEIHSKVDKVVVKGADRIIDLGCSLQTSYSQRCENFAKYSLRGDVVNIDLAPRPTSAKGVLRWALEKYTLFHVFLRGMNCPKFAEMCLRWFAEASSLISRYVFGVGGDMPSRSSVLFYLGNDMEIHYQLKPPHAVVRELVKLGVPRRHVEDVILYFLAVAVAMLNPLDCYNGEPAVPVLRVGSRGLPTHPVLEARDFDMESGKCYGENLMEERICTFLGKR